MSAVSKSVMPASSAARTTAVLRSSSMRVPKLLQPSPTRETSSDPSFRVSMRRSVPGGWIDRAGSGTQERVDPHGVVEALELPATGRLVGDVGDVAERRDDRVVDEHLAR